MKPSDVCLIGFSPNAASICAPQDLHELAVPVSTQARCKQANPINTRVNSGHCGQRDRCKPLLDDTYGHVFCAGGAMADLGMKDSCNGESHARPFCLPRPAPEMEQNAPHLLLPLLLASYLSVVSPAFSSTTVSTSPRLQGQHSDCNHCSTPARHARQGMHGKACKDRHCTGAGQETWAPACQRKGPCMSQARGSRHGVLSRTHSRSQPRKIETR